MIGNNFFSLYRKNGCKIILNILYTSSPLTECNFFKKLKEETSLNTFYRIKDVLLKYQLIEYDLTSEKYEKTISLTNKGKKIYSLLKEIETFF